MRAVSLLGRIMPQAQVRRINFIAPAIAGGAMGQSLPASTNIPLTWEISISALAGYGRQGFH